MKPKKVLVCSAPKSGTYLLSNILECININPTYWHLGFNSYEDYSSGNKEEHLTHPEKYRKPINLKKSLSRLAEGSFAVSHLGPREIFKANKFRDDIQIIVLIRNLRHCLPSYCRFIERTGRWEYRNGWVDIKELPLKLSYFLLTYKDLLTHQYESISQWRNELYRSNVNLLTYEGITGQLGLEAKKHELHILNEILKNSISNRFVTEEELEKSLRSDSLTKSKSNYSYDEWWNENSENIFDLLGLRQINEVLGYEKNQFIKLRHFYFSSKKVKNNCPVCKKSVLTLLNRSDRYFMGLETVGCNFCGHAFVMPTPSKSAMTDFYKNHYWRLYAGEEFESERKKSTLRYHEIISCLQKDLLLKHNSRIIDVGSGSGGCLIALKQLNYTENVTGTDPSIQAVEDLHSMGFTSTVQCDWEEQSLMENNPVDFAFCVHVLEHSTKPEELLLNIHKSLKAGGILYLEVPDSERSLNLGINCFHIGHTQYFSTESLKYLIKRCGYNILHIKHGVVTDWPWATSFICIKTEQINEPIIKGNDIPKHASVVKCLNTIKETSKRYSYKRRTITEKIKYHYKKRIAKKVSQLTSYITNKSKNILKPLSVIWKVEDEITRSHNKLISLHNIHHTRCAFILGNGPSLKIEYLNKLGDEITFGANMLYRCFTETKWRPTYYVIGDLEVAKNFGNEIRQNIPSTMLVGDFLAGYFKKHDNIVYFNKGHEDYDETMPEFSGNPIQVVHGGYSVTYLSLQLAWWMGIREFYLLGVDCKWNADDYEMTGEQHGTKFKTATVKKSTSYFIKDYFKEGERCIKPSNIKQQILALKSAKEFIESHGGKIFNAASDSPLEVFERVDFDSLF